MSTTISPTVNLPSIVSLHSQRPSSDTTASRGERARSGSLVKVEQVGGKLQEEELDRVYANANVEWVNKKGAWLIQPVLIIIAKMVVDSMPGMTQQASWTIINLTYLLLSYIMFHWFTGIPFQQDIHSGAYDDFTLWEQIDEGAQYTPAKKWLICVPIVLFLASTHYTNYNPWLFAVNFTALLIVLFPKLPQLHRQRVRFMPTQTSGMVTPGYGTPYTPASRSRTPLSSELVGPALALRLEKSRSR